MGGRAIALGSYLWVLLALVPAGAEVDFTSSNLPIVIIDTGGETIVDEPKITAYMGVIWKPDGARNHTNDPHNDYTGQIAIELRGSISQGFPKRSYAFETREETGANRNVSLLGLPSENDWVLYGPYCDKTLMRNTLTLDLLRDMGYPASRTRYCELILNDDYRGLYVLLERTKPDRARVPIEKLTPNDLAGDARTGGYIIKIDKETGLQSDGFESRIAPYPEAWQSVRYQFDHPRPDRIAPEQHAYIENHIHAFEAVMNAATYTDPWCGYYDWIATDSFVDGLIITEFCRNVDGYRLSTFLYKNRDSIDRRLILGPLWDFNLAYGNANFYTAWEPTGWQVEFRNERDPYPIPFWWQRLRDDPTFVNRLACRWKQLRRTLLATPVFFDRIAVQEAAIREARMRNFERWPVLGIPLWGNWFVGDTYQEELGYLKDWVLARLAWLDAAMPSPAVEVVWTDPRILVLMGDPGETRTLSCNELFTGLTGADSVTLSCEVSDLMAEVVGDSISWRAASCGAHAYRALAWKNGETVAISPRYAYHVQPRQIVITEIMYRAAPEADGGDWVELFNADGEPHDLSGWQIRDECDDHIFCFPAGTELDAGSYGVLVRDEAAFRRTYAAGDLVIIGAFDFGLGRDDQVRLYDAAGNLRDWVDYCASPPWPEKPDGNGPSLELNDPMADNRNPAVWRESRCPHGSPGTTGTCDDPPQVGSPCWLAGEISFRLSQEAVLQVGIHDVNGRRVRRLVRGETFARGLHTLAFDGCDDRACRLPSGFYYATITAMGMLPQTVRFALVW